MPAVGVRSTDPVPAPRRVWTLTRGRGLCNRGLVEYVSDRIAVDLDARRRETEVRSSPRIQDHNDFACWHREPHALIAVDHLGPQTCRGVRGLGQKAGGDRGDRTMRLCTWGERRWDEAQPEKRQQAPAGMALQTNCASLKSGLHLSLRTVRR